MFFVILFILTLVFIGALVIFYAAPELIEKAIDEGNERNTKTNMTDKKRL